MRSMCGMSIMLGMKEFRYVKLTKTMLNVLMRASVPLYMHRKKGNHIYTVWQHLILLAFRQYEGKSYRRFYKDLYYQRNKNETILSVIKRMFGEHITSRSVKDAEYRIDIKGNSLQMHRLSVFVVWFLQNHLDNKICLNNVRSNATA